MRLPYRGRISKRNRGPAQVRPSVELGETRANHTTLMMWRIFLQKAAERKQFSFSLRRKMHERRFVNFLIPRSPGENLVSGITQVGVSQISYKDLPHRFNPRS
jgi:hypothetical protein